MDHTAIYTIAGCATAFFINIIVVAYGYGKIHQKVDDLGKKQDHCTESITNFGTKINTICTDVGYLKGRINRKGA